MLEGVSADSHALHYSNDKPLTSFFCPHKKSILRPQVKLHYAKIFEDILYWRYSLDGDLSSSLKSCLKVWLKDEALLTAKLMTLKSIKLQEESKIHNLDKACSRDYLLPISH